MKDSFKNIDELLKQSLEGYKKEPSVGVWKRISLRLLLIERGLYFILTAFFIAVVTGTFFYLNNNTASEINFDKENISTIVSEEINLAKEQENSVKPIESKTNKHLTTNAGNEIKAETTEESEILGTSQKSSVLSKNNEPDMILSSTAENNIEANGLTENKNIHYNVYPGLERLDKMDKTKSIEMIAFSGLHFN